ncbi:MAG TPA: ATP-binding protein [Candidatus Kapabacteria bacterium]|nr:ATP-binding protein [Candidatus Kapabacteria bacterium]
MVNGDPGTPRALHTPHIDIYRRAFDAINNPITILDIEKKVLWCNKAMSTLIGKPLAGIVGRPVCRLIDPGSAHSENCIFNQTKEPAVFLLTDRWFAISGEPLLDDSGTITGYVHIMTDITERRKAEEEIKKQHDQLLQADKMISLGILASGMAHEINNPNNSIMLNASVLQKAWNSIIPILNEFYRDKGSLLIGGMKYEKMKEKMPHLFAGILESSKKIQRIVNDLKYFSGKDLISLKKEVDVESVVKSAISLTGNMIQKSTRHFKAVYEKDLPNVMANFQNLEQVIINLVQNACQALENPGNGIFITVTYDRPNREIVLTVKDEGIGIPDKDLKYIAEPFFTSKRSSGGTGLGLYMSSKIISDHGGTIRFASTPGKGTTVEVRLPALTDGVLY